MDSETSDTTAVSVKEAAARIGLSEVHLRRLIKRGDLKVKRVGVRILVPLSSLAEFLRAS